MYLITVKTKEKTLGFVADDKLDDKLKELKRIHKDWESININKK